MIEVHKEKVEEVFCEILQETVFMFGDEVSGPSDLAGLQEGALAVEMKFTGEQAGSLLLAVDQAICPELAANMLALDPTDEMAKERGKDALKELLNITCGHLLTEVAGSEAVFDLTVPELRELTAEEWSDLVGAPGTALFEVDEHPALLRFEMH